jgi:uncharacterized protein
MNDDILQFLFSHKNRIGLCFSLDGYEELHNYGRAGHKTVVKSINAYKKIFGASPVVNCTVTQKTIENIKMLIEYFESNELLNVAFSQVTDVVDKDLYVSDEEYNLFLAHVCQSKIISRQSIITKKEYDCRKYGKLCGVGRTNIFMTKQGVYPCGRFFGNESFIIGEYKDPLKFIAEMPGNFYPMEVYAITIMFVQKMSNLGKIL